MTCGKQRGESGEGAVDGLHLKTTGSLPIKRPITHNRLQNTHTLYRTQREVTYSLIKGYTQFLVENINHFLKKI